MNTRTKNLIIGWVVLILAILLVYPIYRIVSTEGITHENARAVGWLIGFAIVGLYVFYDIKFNEADVF
jgi:hypothetical protein